MRKIKFRGKAKMTIAEMDEIGIRHENGWVYGNLITNGKRPYIVGDVIEVNSEYIVLSFWVPVYFDTVGQYTGIKDSNGDEIYEGDILEIRPHYETPKVGRVIFKDGAILFDDGGYSYLGDVIYYADVTEIVGNIYENPELLEGD